MRFREWLNEQGTSTASIAGFARPLGGMVRRGWNTKPKTMKFNEDTVNHVRIVEKRTGRRINDAAGSSHTLCGGAMTDRDISYQDATQDMQDGWKWLHCEKCRELIKNYKHR